MTEQLPCGWMRLTQDGDSIVVLAAQVAMAIDLPASTSIVLVGSDTPVRVDQSPVEILAAIAAAQEPAAVPVRVTGQAVEAAMAAYYKTADGAKSVLSNRSMRAAIEAALNAANCPDETPAP